MKQVAERQRSPASQLLAGDSLVERASRSQGVTVPQRQMFFASANAPEEEEEANASLFGRGVRVGGGEGEEDANALLFGRVRAGSRTRTRLMERLEMKRKRGGSRGTAGFGALGAFGAW